MSTTLRSALADEMRAAAQALGALAAGERLDFALDGSIVDAARSKRVHRSLHAKVSRERVGKELEGMLSGKHAPPGSALDAIARLCTWRCRCSPSRGRSLAIGSAWAAP